jgi:SAM-dependent methyltransferase
MPPSPTFDGLAPHYRWLERLTFGDRLQWCRAALLPCVADSRRVLVVGDGNGRFLEAFLRANPVAAVDAVDISPGMTRLARTRVGGTERVRFHVADVRTDPLPGSGYDLVVTNFVLDCFPADQLEVVIDRLAEVCGPGGRRTAGRVALTGMYAFFRAITRIPARRLVDPGPMLAARGFAPIVEASRWGGFLSARLWQSNPGSTDRPEPLP